MTRKHDKNTEDILKDIPNGKIIINRHNSTHENAIFNKDFRYCSDGRGLVDTYSVFPELNFLLIITMQIVLNFSIDLSTLLCRSITAEVEEWAGKCRINPQYIWAPEIYLSTHYIHVRILP